VAIESYTMNITTVQGFDAFKASVVQKDDPSKSRVDLILSCVDNYEARITINQVQCPGGGGCKRQGEGAGVDPSRCRVDLILSCVDSNETHITINQIGRPLGGGGAREGGVCDPSKNRVMCGVLQDSHHHQPGTMLGRPGGGGVSVHMVTGDEGGGYS
jgi:hypothetical protein